jgi:hypothetical protein
MAAGHRSVGLVAMARGDLARAADAFTRAAQLFKSARNTSNSTGVSALQPLGRIHLWQGNMAAARQELEESLRAEAHLGVDLPLVALALGGLEQTFDKPEAFRELCRQVRADHPSIDATPFQQWFLEGARPVDSPRRCVQEGFHSSPSSPWVWVDPLQDGSYTVGQGLRIDAAPGRDLHVSDCSAPRLLRPQCGDFALQTVCLSACGEKPAIGGLLLWKDKRNFLRVISGYRWPGEISFEGLRAGEPLSFGRGRLPAERVHLRMERIGETVRALCSADGHDWFTVGQASFPVADPVQVGLHAIGWLDHWFYHGECWNGTAIRFECLEVWGSC